MRSTSSECWATEKAWSPNGLAVPARHAGEPVRDVVDLDVERRRVEQIEPAARQHALPGAVRGAGPVGHAQSSAAPATAGQP